MSATPDLFGEALSELAAGPRVGSFNQVTKALMQRLSEKGLTLAQCADKRMMNRSLSTLQAHAREFELSFPDYVPQTLRIKVEFVRMGDFYEVIGDEAEPVAKHLGIVVMKRNGSPMCGVPVHAFEDYKSKLEPTFLVKIAKAKKPRKAAAVG